MSKIVVNRDVADAYRSGKSLNDAIRTVFKEEIENRISEDENLKDLSPLNLVMRDAGISKYSSMQELLDTATYTSGGIDSNEWLFPAWLETTLREAAYGQDIVSYLCDTTIGVDSNIVKSAMLDLMSDENKPNIKKMRVSEGADLPLAKIKVGDKAISLWKYGRAIEMSYEAMRRMRIDVFTRHMNAIAADMAFQNADSAIDVLQKGDGNGNAAEKIATVASVDNLNSEAVISFLIDYWMKNHFAADTMTMNTNAFKKLVGMTFNPSLSAGAAARFSFTAPQLGTQNIVLLAANVPQIGSKDVIMLSNRSNSLIRYEENGSNIQENQNFVRNQTSILTLSENSGYAIGTKGSNMFVEITA